VRALLQEENNEQASSTRNLEAKMHSNFQRAAEHPVMIPAGMDNRSSTLHGGRYAGGAGVLLQRHWHEGRKSWGAAGIPSISNYDMEAVSAAGCVTAKGWDMLHHPGNPDISIRMFSVTNVGQSASGARMVQVLGEEGIAVHDNMKDVSDMAELKLAIRNLRLAAHQAASWNFTFEVLDGFLLSNDYMEKELAGVNKKAAVLSGFVDHILKINAARYTQDADFLDATRMMATWTAWWGARKSGISFSGNNNGPYQPANNNGGGNNKAKSRNNNSGGFNNSGGGFNSGGGNFPRLQAPFHFPPARSSGPPNNDNMCRRFNNGQCSNHWSACSVSTNKGPLRLFHLCNYSVKRDGKFEPCKQKHMRMEHEKLVGKNN